ncbi:MAG: PQQ-binding-like beta-propeller repeat protein [Pirellulales bacterium]|nr:PQQ-binding-like beta-propeller repeat protein [Pirellulales bacterium]
MRNHFRTGKSPYHQVGRVFFLAIGVILCLAQAVTAEDWPQWRGTNRDGFWREDGIVSSFNTDKLVPKWRTPISSGYSGPTVSDGRVYVMDRLAEPQQRERVLCLNAETGEELWKLDYACEYERVGYTAGPRASVTIDDGRAFALGTMGHFHCLDAANGDVLWSHDLNAAYSIRMPIWGIAASPLVYGDLVIVQIGGEDVCLVAFDKKTGEEKWQALDHEASYSSPIIHKQGDQNVLICWTGGGIVGLNPENGTTLWSQEFKPRQMVINIATPIIDNNRMFLTSFYDGAFMLRLSADAPAAEDMWRRAGPNEQRTDALHSIISTPVFLGDHVYGADSYGELRCLEAATGDRVWSTNKPFQMADDKRPGRWSTIHFVQHGNQTWMLTERGDLIIAELSPQGYKEIDRAHLIDPTMDQLRRRGGVVWSHPAFANRCIFARNDKEIVCASLAVEQ